MKMTLLEIVQNILSSMDSDEVNSIADTVESLQIAEVVKETYSELFANLDEPSRWQLRQLQALGDSDKPNYLELPEDVRIVKWIKYDFQTDGSTDYQYITYMEPEDFLVLCTGSRGSEATVEVIDTSGARFNIANAKNPQYWTTFDNNTIIFDSYNSDVETTLQQQKTLVWALVTPSWEMVDTFTPEMDADQFPQLLAEAKATCFVNFKQTPNAREEHKARRQQVRRQDNLFKMRQRDYRRVPNYGRTPR